MPLSAPTKIETPFATSGSKNTIPVPSQIGVTPGAASYTDGFPPLTMTPLASGGVPPFGQDFNGVLYEITNAMQWQQAMSGAYAYDSAFAIAVGGYPLGAAVLRSDGLGLWINQTANNSTDPEAGGSGWMPLIQTGATSVAMTGSNVTLTSLQAGKDIIIISGAITGNLNLIFPTYVKTWTVVNNTSGAYTITAKTASGTGVTLSQDASTQILGDGINIIMATNSQSIAAGFIRIFSGATAPAGYMKANGAAISRDTYSNLFAVIGTTFGIGNGSSTFNLPDLRGEFIRCWDDGRGIDSGRTIGSWQKGTLVGYDKGDDAVFSVSATSSDPSTSRSVIGVDAYNTSDYAGATLHGVSASGEALPGTSGLSGGYTGISRPRNISLLACIKY